jgi:8-oxo-dGTP pyrophosphatase MutT (NUDIX family)
LAATSDAAPPIPAATVVLLRDRAGGPEALLLRRNAALSSHAGLWVFPGGRIDPEDARTEDGTDDLAAARRAAVREAKEEASLDVDGESLVPFAHWCPPAAFPVRFATWFFVGRARAGAVVVDNGEIEESRWLRPGDALAMHGRGELALITPTWVTLHDFAACASVADALAWARVNEPFRYESRIVSYADGRVALFPGDAGWARYDEDVPGPRHRLWMPEVPPWRLERGPRATAAAS